MYVKSLAPSKDSINTVQFIILKVTLTQHTFTFSSFLLAEVEQAVLLVAARGADLCLQCGLPVAAASLPVCTGSGCASFSSFAVPCL